MLLCQIVGVRNGNPLVWLVFCFKSNTYCKLVLLTWQHWTEPLIHCSNTKCPSITFVRGKIVKSTGNHEHTQKKLNAEVDAFLCPWHSAAFSRKNLFIRTICLNYNGNFFLLGWGTFYCFEVSWAKKSFRKYQGTKQLHFQIGYCKCTMNL